MSSGAPATGGPASLLELLFGGGAAQRGVDAVHPEDVAFLCASPGGGRLSSADYPAAAIFDSRRSDEEAAHTLPSTGPHGGRLSSADYPRTLFDGLPNPPPEDSSSTLSDRSTANEAEINLEPHPSRFESAAARSHAPTRGRPHPSAVHGEVHQAHGDADVQRTSHVMYSDTDAAFTDCSSGDEQLGMHAVKHRNDVSEEQSPPERGALHEMGHAGFWKHGEDAPISRRRHTGTSSASGTESQSASEALPVPIDPDGRVVALRHLRLRPGVSLSGEESAADAKFCQQVVRQLESADPQQAISAAAVLEYLVSSSDPKRESLLGREGFCSHVQWRWSAEGAKVNRRTLGLIPGLWRNLLGLLTKSNAATQAQVCGAMSKLGFRNTKNVLEMIKYPKMLVALTRLLDLDTHPQDVVVQAWRVLQNWVSGMEEVKVVLCSTEPLLMRIKQACTHERSSAEVRMRAVSVIMHASSSDEARLLLIKAKVAEEALQVVMSAGIKPDKEEATRIRATLASANLCGREERSFLSTAPEMLRAIGETMWHAFHGTEYHDIKWSLAGVMLPLFNLSCSDSNKRVLIQTGTVSLLLKAVSEAASTMLQGTNCDRASITESEAPAVCSPARSDQQVRSGGKLPAIFTSFHRQDSTLVEDSRDWSAETLELMLRTLANFTFDADAKEQMQRENACAILRELMSSLRGQQDEALAVSAIPIAEHILYMLSEKNEDMITETGAVTAQPDGKRQHIMISYSWAQGKDFVVEVSGGLRKAGFDVWRDEEGSQLVRKMMGSSMEMMAKAIEYADVVIIFVSRAYRDSYNCKLEGKYAQVRERAGLTKILFVMMEEDYTPEATGGVDGWLGMLIGDHIYYPGWDPTKLDETVAELCRAVHKMRNETKFPLNTLDPPLSQGKNPRPKAPERTPLGDSELDKSVLSLGRRDARYRGGDEFGQKHSGDRALLTPSASAASMQVHAGSSSQRRSSAGRHFGAPSPSGSLGEGVGAVGIKLESRLSRVDEVGMSGHDVAAPTRGLTVREDAAIELEASSAVSTPDRESVESLATHAGKEAGVKGVLDAATLRLAAAVFSGDAPADGSQSSLRRTGEGAGWMGPCESIDDFLDGYGLWEIRDKFVYHGIDDMQVVLRLTSTHIARVTDRVGMQVRLEDAVTRERQLCGFASHLPGSACSTPAPPSRHMAQPSPD